MEKDLRIARLLHVSSDDSFYAAVNATRLIIPAIEAQGYETRYNGRILYQPGVMGIIGIPGTGKSTFINSVLDGYAPDDFQVSEKLHSSHTKDRLVQVWKRWTHPEGLREIRVQDEQALASLGHVANTRPPEIEASGLCVYEHPGVRENYCDAVIRFSYGEDGKRLLELRITPKVVEHSEFDNFISQTEDLAL